MTTFARILFLAIIASAMVATALTAQNVFTDFDEASTLSKQEGKPLMVVFSGSDWCKPCILFKKQVLETPDFQSFSRDRLIVCNLDFPFRKQNQLPKAQREKNDAVAARYNPEGAFPLVLLIDESGGIRDRIDYRTHSGSEAFIAQVSASIGQ